MTYNIAGDAVVARPFHAINSIQFHRNNILTSADFAPTPPKSQLEQLWERLVQVVTQAGNP